MISPGNDFYIDSEPLKDINGVLITSGTVNIGILKEDKTTVLVADGLATHTAGGVWRRQFDASDIASVSVGEYVWSVVKVGLVSAPDATRYRLEPVRDIDQETLP